MKPARVWSGFSFMQLKGKINMQAFIGFITLGCLLILPACNSNNGTSEKDKEVNDSLSRVEQRKASDSARRSNPLLIVPPDSTYTGSYVDKYPNGITKFTGFFRFGQRHGQWLSFYPSGLAWSEMHYDKGLRHGPNIAYYPDGKKRYEGVYKNDKQDSIWCYYDSLGVLAEKVLFKESRIVKKLPK